jgi:hypothetical protein
MSLNLFSQTISVNWNQQLRKEIDVSCSLHEEECIHFCAGHQACKMEEKFCRDCIGTSLWMSHLLDSLGREITNKKIHFPIKDFFKNLKGDKYIAMTPDDIYNVIDPYRSIHVYNKFAALCPEESLSQIIFLSTGLDRKIGKAEVIYCNYINGHAFYELDSSPDLNINWLRQHNIFK